MNAKKHLPDSEAAALLAELEQVSDLDELRPAARQGPAQALGLDCAGLRHERQVARRMFRDDREARRTARELLTPLPSQGTTLHLILPGSFVPLDLVPALLELIGQDATALRLATLGFSVQNVESLCEMLDSRKVRALSLICSRFFQAASKSIFAIAESELSKRGAKLVATRCHCKVALIKAGKQRWTFEGSGNLRSCTSLEQIALCNDPKLYRFHRAWFDHVLSGKEN